MNRTLLELVLRHADGLAGGGADADLVRRIAAGRDEAAFAAVVARHGPMVWAVCRQTIPNRADAEDAFQATFLALARGARRVRRPEQLAAWLHGAAVRVAGKAKRAHARRAAHERSASRPEADSPVSALAWDEVQVALHAEVAGLPPSLRAAFVLCDLEGVDQPAAAERLGIRVNTLSGQLARARRAILERLSRRGVGPPAVAIAATAPAPQALAEKAAALAGAGAAPPAGVVALAAEVTAMSATNPKLLACAVLACGLTAGLLSGVGNGRPGAGAGDKPVEPASPAARPADKPTAAQVLVYDKGKLTHLHRLTDAKEIAALEAFFPDYLGHPKGGVTGAWKPGCAVRFLFPDGRTESLTVSPPNIEPTVWYAGKGDIKVAGDFHAFVANLNATKPADKALALTRAMEGFRKVIPPPQGLNEENGQSFKEIEPYVTSHLAGVARRLGVTTKDEGLVLLTYLKDPDGRIRWIAVSALDGLVKAYSHGLTASDIADTTSEGHLGMVLRFTELVGKLSDGPK